jgi:uncharacterized membrane-anchored protein YhcB (DUF1043 family)
MGLIKFFYENSNKELENIVESLSENDQWIHFKLDELSNIEVKVGCSNLGLYQIIISKNFEYWQYRVMDFLGYIEESNINGVIEISKDNLEEASRKYNTHTYKDNFIRDYEQSYLVHSSASKNWISILQTNQLLSWNTLKQKEIAHDKNPIGLMLNDPKEYSEYVMLGTGISSEIVVSSSVKNKVNCDVDCTYEPGVRLYIDSDKIAKDGLLIRDGAHLKVKDKINLDEYLILAVTPDLLSDNNKKEWTPKLFAKEADQVFISYFESNNGI